MNYVYLVCSGKFQEQLPVMLRSLFKHCHCKVLLHVFDVGSAFQKMLKKSFPGLIDIFEMPKQEWEGQRMFCKVRRLLSNNFVFGDNVFVLDTDLFIQANIFEVFKLTFDVCYTTRHYKYWAPANGGVWGFRYNERSQIFLDFFIKQMSRPSWLPYIEYKKRVKHGVTNLDWWCDQDFLCALHENNKVLPFSCKVVDLGPRYNFCPGLDVSDSAREEIQNKVGDSNYPILHFKAQLKPLLMNLGK